MLALQLENLMNFKINKKIISALIITLVFSPIFVNAVISDDVDILNDQIEEKKQELEVLDREIERQRQAVQNASGRADNLENNIYQLEASRSKLLTDISETETKIDKAKLTIVKLNIEIDGKEALIEKNSAALAESIRKVNNLKSTSLVEKILGFNSLSDFWNEFEQTERIQKRLSTEVDNLIDLNDDLKEQEHAQLIEKSELSQYQVELSSEREAVEYAKQEKNSLLKETKNEEAVYQKILEENLAKRRAFEDELLEIESHLKTLVDPGSYVESRSGVFSWPAVNFIISQYFGSTSFAKSSGLYSTNSHNGVDFAIPLGTQVLAVSDGVVKGTGNTDAFPGCNSWGKWVLIEHSNGLSTLYAHLSSISVSPGQNVKREEIIALSGSTGVSTGPHLHLTTYATQGVQIRNYRDVARSYGCGAYDVSIPMASPDAYLDPMDYLPG